MRRRARASDPQDVQTFADYRCDDDNTDDIRYARFVYNLFLVCIVGTRFDLIGLPLRFDVFFVYLENVYIY